MQQRTALITGASSGIGAAFAEVFAAEGFDLVITARRDERLRALGERLEQRHGGRVHLVVGDLARRDATERLCSELNARGIHVDALVNNAGYGVPGAYTASAWSRHHDFLQVMVISVVELTYRLLPPMIEHGYGRVVNVASLAGIVPAPAGHTLYGASKAFLIKFSEALSSEVRGHGVHVTAICPGFTRSEFHDVTGTRQQMRVPQWMWLDASTVARQGFDAVMTGTPVYINGRLNRVIAAFVKYTPEWLVRAAGRRFGKRYRNV